MYEYFTIFLAWCCPEAMFIPWGWAVEGGGVLEGDQLGGKTFLKGRGPDFSSL